MKHALYITVTFAVMTAACSTCPPCVPEHEIREVLIPTYSCPEPPDLPPMVLPDWPVLPDNATDAQRKQWYVDAAVVVNARLDILNQRIADLDAILNAYGEK